MNGLITALADFALAGSCLIFSWKLWSQHAPNRNLNNSFFGLFLTSAIAALAVGLRHSSPGPPDSPTLMILNASVLILAGLAGYNVWLIDAQLIFNGERFLQIVRWIFRLLFVLYLLLIWRHADFFSAIIGCVPAAVILLVIASMRALHAKNRFYFFGVIGVLFCLCAAWVEIKPFDLQPIYLTHDIIYDILQGLGLWGVYLFGSRAARLKGL